MTEELAVQKKGISERDIRAKYDPHFKLLAGIKKLERGFYLTDQEMRTKCGIATNVWRSYSEMPEFSKYRIKLGGIIHWGMPEGIKKLSEDLNVI